MFDFDQTEPPPVIVLPEDSHSLIQLPKKQAIFQPPPIDPAVSLKWGLALLGEEKAKQYLAWLELRLHNEFR